MIGRHFSLLWLAALGLAIPVSAQVEREGILPGDILYLIAEVREDLYPLGDYVWPGYSEVPSGMIFVGEEEEILLCDERLPEGFIRLEPDDTLNCPRAYGPRTNRSSSLMAAMAPFGPPMIIVLGTPADSGRRLAQWQMSFLHEHFHQWQSSLPGYFERVAELDLAGEDTTGMWMLDYPFPYDDPLVAQAYDEAARALREAVLVGDIGLLDATRAYLAKRKAFAEAVGDDNWRYFEFQLWQEGVARWTEIDLATSSRDIVLARTATAFTDETLDDLTFGQLAELRREVVYAYGAAEAMLLERIDRDWRGCYRVSLALGPCWDSLLLGDPPPDDGGELLLDLQPEPLGG